MSIMDSRNLSLWKNWMLRLFILAGMACWCMPSVQIVPKFTSVPPSVSYFVPSATEPDPVDLICRAWPPNAKLYLLATQLPAPIQLAEHTPSSSAGADASVPRANSALLSIPPGLASQRYAVLTAAQLSAAQSGNRPVPESSLRPVIIHETLVDAIRERPAAAPSDEVAVRLTVTNLADVRQLELMRLHCLVATAFGRLLSSPFHVIPTSLGDFPQPAVSTGQGNMPSPLRYSVEFLSNNIAVVDCHLPLNSFPIPTVQFELNGTVLDTAGVHADRYRQVLRHDRRRVSLLIHKVQAHDQGVYRCVVTNRLTGEKKYSPEETHLKLVVPTSPVQTRIVVPLASSSSHDQSFSKSQEIIVNEGQNVTLFCIIQSAPPPTVATYPFDQNFTHDSRFQLDEKFGLLRITNVKPKDAGFYMCSDRHLTSTSQLRVNSRLRFEVKPHDVKIGRLGDGAQFKCASSDAQVTPYWLFNGQPKTNTGIGRGTFITIVSNQNTLTITNVTANDLGVYQCVAHRKSTKVLEDEWLSASATLSLESDNLVRTPEELGAFTPKSPQPMVEVTPEVTTKDLTPKAEAVYDNLAVYLVWQPLRPELSGIEHTSKEVEYRLEYSVQTSPAEEQRNNPNATRPLTALVGLVGHEAVRWSDPTPLKQQTSTPYAYVTGDPLKPSKRYRFRTIAVDPSTGVSLVPPSDWSNVVSMEHISMVEPPQIKMVRPLSNGRIHLMWIFDGADESSHKLAGLLDVPATAQVSGPDRMGTSTGTFPGFESDSGSFVPDHFLVLARPLVKPKSDSSGSYEYGAYWATRINGSEAREGMLTGLNRTASYQVIVYGVRGDGDRRQITRFSKAAYVNLATADHAGPYSLLRSLINNRLMYIILGGIAAVMFFVVLVCILLCLCRQRRGRRESSQRKKQNGFVQSYKDTTQYMPVSTTDGNQSATGMNNQSNGAGNMMIMSNLQCSAFSDHSASNHGGGTQVMNGTLQHHQQQAELKHQQQQQLQQQQQQQQQFYLQHQQQQQADQYAAAMAMSKELMQQQQQHQSMLGSQMHLHQPSQQNPMVYHHPQHHQSHHSLLFPSSGPVHQIPPAPMYQSGTLPGGPRYMRQGFAGTHHQFGSQQPLNRATTPAQQGMGDGMMEYHMQTGVYAHQQPQLPPVPHPQSTDMPTHHLMLNGTQRSMGYYPGPMTPSGTSLKREPPTGGSLQDGSAYGTLLQRGQLTGSVIHDPSVGPMSPPVGYAAQYYHGSQQALHMGQNMYPSGMASPQPGHGPPVYSPPPPPPPLPQQQQAMFASQPGYPGYYGQTFSPQPEPMGHNPHGFGPTDGESIYSYFSQQEMGQSNAHQPLNPLPEENQTGNGAGFVDSGMQTGDGGNDAGPEGSPAGGGSHRHHRRRRRKQQQQQQRTTGELSNGSNRLNDQGDSAPGEGTQFGEVHSNTQLDEQRPSFDHEMTAPKRHHSISAGTYSDADPNSTQQSFNMSNDASRPGYMRFDSPQRGQMFTGQMPPPNQPPPPPPPAVALGLTMPGLVNGGGGVAVSSQEHPNMHQNSLNNYGADSLSRRPNGAPSVGATGTPVTGAYPTSGPGLLVGPPPRIRDYSEYGIPRGIGLPPTPSAPAGGGQPQPPQHNVLMGNPAMVQHGHSNMMMYEGRYREGQA